MVDLEKAKFHLEELGLLNAGAILDALLERVQRENSTYIAFLNSILEDKLTDQPASMKN